MANRIFYALNARIGTDTKDHPWFHFPVSERPIELPGDPDVYVSLAGFTHPSNPIALLYRRRTGDSVFYGVYWGPIPIGKPQLRFPSAKFALLAEFYLPNIAAVFLSGLLIEWWPRRLTSNVELGDAARAAVEGTSSELSVLSSYLERCLSEWQARPPELPIDPALQSFYPLWARISDEKVADLGCYLGQSFAESQWITRSCSEITSLDVGIVVGTGLCLDRLYGAWRVLTEDIGQNGWAAIPSAIAAGPVNPRRIKQRPQSESRPASSSSWLSTVLKNVQNVKNFFVGGSDESISIDELFKMLLLHDSEDTREKVIEALIHRLKDNPSDASSIILTAAKLIVDDSTDRAVVRSALQIIAAVPSWRRNTADQFRQKILTTIQARLSDKIATVRNEADKAWKEWCSLD